MDKIIIAGPCVIESEEQFFKTIEFLTSSGIKYIRGGIKKYRSDPGTYQGTEMAIEWVKKARKVWDFKFVSEVFSIEGYEDFIRDHIDVIQIGSRNMHNTDLLKKISLKFPEKTILFKRHYSASLNEFVKHSEYLPINEVWMCLRGIQSLHPTEQRFFPDLSDIVRLKEKTDNKIIFDASHAACESRFVPYICKAANALGVDGLSIEVHPNPDEALSDPQQQLDFIQFTSLKSGFIF